ncbi:MAG: alginate O-acetyltransferase complex protein AlgI [Bacteroidales bacterium]|nr:alginate O-acetyltransferase complex protein AlgI [Bacteroidales bacterium]
MQLTSTLFFVFISIVVITYYLIDIKFQWIVLLIASYVFYYLASPKTLVYLIITTVSTFICGLIIQSSKTFKSGSNNSININLIQKIGQKKNIENVIILIAFLINFGILAFFKYYDSIFSNLNSIIFLSPKSEIPYSNLVLPLGISFYTFQSFGYLIDIKRGKIKSERNIAKFALFISFFPQIIQGPISRYSELAKQFFEEHKFNYSFFIYGSQLMLWGYFKKIVIADKLAPVVNTVFENFSNYDGVYILLASILYSIQIYCDFSGGIDIVRGLAEILGISLPKNFLRPFLAQSVEEYWRRWHITLGAWVREYVFYPLSLSKGLAKLGRFLRKFIGNYLGKLIPTFISMIVTFLIIGIWHGTQWKYIAFGLYHGSIIILEILLKPISNNILSRINYDREVFSWHLFKVSLTFLLVSIGRYFARADGFKYALRMLKRTFTNFNFINIFFNKNVNLGIDGKDVFVIIVSIAIVIFIELLQESGIGIRQKFQEQNAPFRWLILSILIISILVFGSYGIGFNENDFIYRGF